MLLNTDDLRRWLGYEQPAKIREWLHSKGIPFDEPRQGRILTTEELVSDALRGASREIELDG